MDQRSSRSRIDRSKETVRQNCLQDLLRIKRQSVQAIMPHTSGSTSYGLIASTDDEGSEFVKELEEYQKRQRNDCQQKTSDNLKSQITTNEVVKQDSNRDLVRTIDSLSKYSGGIEAE
ncbi:unnamed protein product [Didymodactylos carnosus]|uniref:Uncharacterized protein n=1 Tax=Didymodactylos carnosus TaxID=1234261 RepID=A0A815VPW5_9BILA|nr:unnamed protein product [Didymodactylos carnosus]CAF1535735.1 unnamed protein product [Didymodactylos carnosus]CAF4202272.1 unnamed protein product [Didymodactylos carnosus]CAF4395490.1 unnamed protein product [Didymodactylos carnosus]